MELLDYHIPRRRPPLRIDWVLLVPAITFATSAFLCTAVAIHTDPPLGSPPTAMGRAEWCAAVVVSCATTLVGTLFAFRAVNTSGCLRMSAALFLVGGNGLVLIFTFTEAWRIVARLLP